ncbi:hypothetical protein [Agrobacterium rubi]|uniref:Uncharacterized protein n=1 Tax=Agrobacterium rubi TaxID=28099 RepID=A0AAE7USI0_9HYPH|nr:hypothetical protein [Agrobacterium rubi]KQR36032.1 hypothetical protein ASF91_20755 [Rhizobium sp. Leaf155]NTE89655.1 hypothetical protein [Agrobacterium rubi]NTF05495.1 hypothetical protein [Agrobacterium rubi]NTF39938.1 hypothetical protein [Agrobacterium rubi]OCJ44766.1 hypothetical protein A6U92_16085 [Agrobacterium rubi]
MPDPAETIKLLAQFTGADLTRKLSGIEGAVRGITADQCNAFLEKAGAGREVLSAAAEMKWLAGQINVTIHALGILLCLPHILEPGEEVQSVSLGAGNTGRDFDLETNYRVAEFKFIRWRGGAESIRQNGIFKDYLMLAEYETEKRKYLYLLGLEHALKFFNGGRAISSVLSRNGKVSELFADRYGDQFRTVRDYFAIHGDAVRIEDVSPWLSELAGDLVTEPDAEDDGM